MTVLVADAPQSAASAAGADRREGLKKPLEYQLGPREVHPFHAAAAPTHEDIKRSLHYPLVVTPNPMAAPQVAASAAGMHKASFAAASLHEQHAL